MIPSPADSFLFYPLLVVGFYFLGSVPFSLLWAKAFGLPDPRTYGSGNPGASNVARSGNRLAAALTFACDALKGTAVLIPKALEFGGPHLWGALAFAAVLGHAFPIFLRFRGGKGVSTALGALLALDWAAFAVAAGAWALIFLPVRISAVASLVSLAAAGIVLLVPGETDLTLLAYLSMLALVAFRHKDNFRRLLNKSENRFS